MRTIDKWAERVALVIGVAGIVVVLGYVVLGVLARELLGSSLHGTAEVTSRWGMVALVFGGLVAAQARREHLRVTLLTRLLDGRTHAVTEIVALGLAVIVALLLAWYGLQAALDAFAEREYGVDTGWPVWPTRFLVPALAIGFLVVLVAQIVRLRRGTGTGADGDGEPTTRRGGEGV